MPSLNFGTEVQYLDIFLEKNYVFFIVNLNEKVFFLCKIKRLVNSYHGWLYTKLLSKTRYVRGFATFNIQALGWW